MRQERLWVHPSFKRRIKREALDREMSVLKLTKEIGEEQNELLRRFDKREKKERLFRI